MTGSSRIRLEGRLEKVERAVSALERGLRAAERLDYTPLAVAIDLQQSPEVSEACEQAQKLSAEDPALQRLLARLWKLRRVAEERVVARSKKLKMTPAPLADAVRGLIADPLIYSGRPNRRWIAYSLLATSIGASLWLTRSGLGMVPLLFAFLAGTASLAPIDVIVTRRRLVLGDVPVPVSEVNTVRFVTHARYGKPAELVVEMKNGDRRTQRVGQVTPELKRALEEVGLTVVVEKVT